MKTQEILITPEIALNFLKSNTRNRQLKEEVVLEYARLMKANLWMENGEPIIFGKGNILLDGQHRLGAIVKSGKSQNCLVVFDVNPDAFSTIDVGKIRSGGDILYINGVKDSKKISSIISAYHATRKGYYTANNNRGISRVEILNIFNENPEFWIEINKKSNIFYKKIALLTASTIGGYMAFLILDKKHDKDFVFNFFFQLFFAENIENNSIILLREKYLKNLTKQYKITKEYKKAIFIKSWNNYVSKTDAKVLHYNPVIESLPNFI